MKTKHIQRKYHMRNFDPHIWNLTMVWQWCEALFPKGSVKQRWVEAFLQTLSLQPLCAAHEAGNLEGWFQCRVQSFGSFWVLHGVVSRWWNRLRWWAPLCSRQNTTELMFRTNHWLASLSVSAEMIACSSCKKQQAWLVLGSKMVVPGNG